MTNIRKQIISEMANEIKEEVFSFSTPTQKTKVEFINSGSTVLNLMLSGKGKNGGWARGRVVNIIGDGSSGKTLLSLEMAARCFHMLNKEPETFSKVKNVKIVYNNVEGVMDFPITEMYGSEFENAVEWIQLPTIESFGRDYTRRVEAMKDGDFLLYIVDSMDTLISEDSQERFLKAAEKDQSEDSSYGMEKQKYSGKFFSNLCGIGQGKDATLVIISQVRENIGVTFGKKYRRAGGKALDFFTHQCCWLAVKNHLKKTVKGETRTYGVQVKAKLERSKVSKPFREADFTILFDYGVDQILSDIVYLFGEKEKNIEFNGQSFGNQEKLVAYIEENNLQDELAEMVEEKWNVVEDGIKANRKKKF
jgi:recombination protein RecA